jgi:hypothetical protein
MTPSTTVERSDGQLLQQQFTTMKQQAVGESAGNAMSGGEQSYYQQIFNQTMYF